MTEPVSSKPVRERHPWSAATWLSAAALLVALIAAFASVFAWYQVAVTARLEAGSQRTVVDRVAADYQSLKQAQDVYDARFDEFAGRLAALAEETRAMLAEGDDAREQALAGLRASFEELSASVRQVYAEIGRSVDTWMLEEAEQLLLLAHQRLALVGDADLAATALRLADGKLEEIGDPVLSPVRQHIADELAALDALPDADIEGAALRLSALSASVPNLPLSRDMERPEWQTGEAEPVPEETAGGVERFAREVLDDLGNLVRIRRVDEATMPKLKPVQRFLVHENLRMHLLLAQQALLRGHGELYRENLDAASDWATRYLATEMQPVVALREEIEALRALPLDRELPSIAESLARLRAVMAERATP